MDISEVNNVQTSAPKHGPMRRRYERYLRFQRACELEIERSLKRRSELLGMARRASKKAWKLIPAAAKEAGYE